MKCKNCGYVEAVQCSPGTSFARDTFFLPEDDKLKAGEEKLAALNKQLADLAEYHKNIRITEMIIEDEVESIKIIFEHVE